MNVIQMKWKQFKEFIGTLIVIYILKKKIEAEMEGFDRRIK